MEMPSEKHPAPHQKAVVALETGAVTTAITPREQRWPRSISVLRCLEEPRMTASVEESQPVVTSKRVPELERLQLRKGKRKRKKRGGGGRRRQNSRVISKAQPKNRTPAKQRFPSPLPLCPSPLTAHACLPAWARRWEHKAKDTLKKSAALEAQAPWNEVCKRIDVAVKGAQAASESGRHHETGTQRTGRSSQAEGEEEHLGPRERWYKGPRHDMAPFCVSAGWPPASSGRARSPPQRLSHTWQATCHL